MSDPQVSVVVCTYNRAESLARALDSLAAQVGDAAFEIVVVDNNSTDATADVIRTFIARGHGDVRHVFEGTQGLCHARNAGIAAARAPIIAFTDDDVRVSADWVSTIKRAFDEHPDIDFVGGRVLPRWEQTPPGWLTPVHWAPLALADYGDRPFVTDSQRQVCLVGATLSLRREVFDRVGLFSPDYQHPDGGVCSTDDHELLLRIWSVGGRGLYLPDLVIHAAVQPERLGKQYHRRWHYDHGHLYAKMRIPEVERCRRTLLGVPAHLYRQAAVDLMEWPRQWLKGDAGKALLHETRLWFFAGFARTRMRAALRTASVQQ